MAKFKYLIAYRLFLNGEELGDASAEVQTAQPITHADDQQVANVLIADAKDNLTVEVEQVTLLSVPDGMEAA